MFRAVIFLAGVAAVAAGTGWGLGWWVGIVVAGLGLCAAAYGAERAAL